MVSLKAVVLNILGAVRHTSALSIGENDPSAAQQFSKDSVLLPEVLDDVLLAALEPTRQGYDEEHPGLRDHRAIVARVRVPIELWDYEVG